MTLALARMELARLARRRSIWVLVGAYAASIVLFGYVLVELVGQGFRSDARLDDAARRELDGRLRDLRPDQVGKGVTEAVSQVAGVVGLLFGALAVGSDYRYGVWQTLVARGVPRRRLVDGKLLALSSWAGLIALMALVVGAVAAFSLNDGPISWPPAQDLAGCVLVSAALLTFWSWLGALLSILTRGVAAAPIAAAGIFAFDPVLLAARDSTGIVGSIAAATPTNIADVLSTAVATGWSASAVLWLGALAAYAILAAMLAIVVARRQELGFE